MPKHFFRKEEEGDCGENAVESILSMYGKYSKQNLNTEEGTSPQKIRKALEKNGIKTKIRDKISFKKIKPRSIAYYPKDDHYVTIGNKHFDNTEILVFDSSKKSPEWIDEKSFDKKWDNWVIETGGEAGSI